MQTNVSSTITTEEWQRWKKSGMKLNKIINLGLQAAEQMPGFINRINELEGDNKRLQEKVRMLAMQLHGGA